MSEYSDRDIENLGGFYTRHAMAMTEEGLHEKSDIAAELGWRDQQIEQLKIEAGMLKSSLLDIEGQKAGDVCTMCNFLERGYCHSKKEELRNENIHLRTLLREAYGYTTAAAGNLPERIKVALKDGL
ncbi:MAG: hypothetical protein N0C84_16900 [Candidatus Thiodiazotropha taylori]|uniref:Uncharacterized protein n=1 Tax=Candidatus Thiodiazotropha taylori TaxID=2792791 RepID=A0A9E4N5S7_9GAMM|nr:hypothetical protein [Candidatus Thiodiazotropha taylori]MCW4258145.1 hypothetical protein [Candidatus Thiodiazotropha taylori]